MEHYCKTVKEDGLVCGESDPEKFYGRNKSKCGYHQRISNNIYYKQQYQKRPEVKEKKNQWARDNSEKVREARYKNRCGLSLEDIENLMEDQDYECPICQDEMDIEWAKSWHVDHDHSCCSGKQACGKCTRGILCMHCNQMLGQAKDNPDVLRKAADYLERYQLSKL